LLLWFVNTAWALNKIFLNKYKQFWIILYVLIYLRQLLKLIRHDRHVHRMCHCSISFVPQRDTNMQTRSPWNCVLQLLNLELIALPRHFPGWSHFFTSSLYSAGKSNIYTTCLQPTEQRRILVNSVTVWRNISDDRKQLWNRKNDHEKVSRRGIIHHCSTYITNNYWWKIRWAI